MIRAFSRRPFTIMAMSRRDRQFVAGVYIWGMLAYQTGPHPTSQAAMNEARVYYAKIRLSNPANN